MGKHGPVSPAFDHLTSAVFRVPNREKQTPFSTLLLSGKSPEQKEMDQKARQGEVEIKLILHFPTTWGRAELDITVRTQTWGGESFPQSVSPMWQTAQEFTLIGNVRENSMKQEMEIAVVN